MSEVEQLFQCIICGVAWSSKQALRGHMKAHKGEYYRTNIYAVRKKWKIFEKICKKHKSTTCHVLDALIEAIIEGDKTKGFKLPTIMTPNPLIINVQHNFLGTPHSPYKVSIDDIRLDKNICHVCGSRVIREFEPMPGKLREGKCQKCGSSWIIDVKPFFP